MSRALSTCAAVVPLGSISVRSNCSKAEFVGLMFSVVLVPYLVVVAELLI